MSCHSSGGAYPLTTLRHCHLSGRPPVQGSHARSCLPSHGASGLGIGHCCPLPHFGQPVAHLGKPRSWGWLALLKARWNFPCSALAGAVKCSNEDRAPWSTKVCWTQGRHTLCEPRERENVFTIYQRSK